LRTLPGGAEIGMSLMKNGARREEVKIIKFHE